VGANSKGRNENRRPRFPASLDLHPAPFEIQDQPALSHSLRHLSSGGNFSRALSQPWLWRTPRISHEFAGSSSSLGMALALSRANGHHAFHSAVIFRKGAEVIVRSRNTWRGKRNTVRFSRTEHFGLGQHARRALRRLVRASPCVKAFRHDRRLRQRQCQSRYSILRAERCKTQPAGLRPGRTRGCLSARNPPR
jgi:hypothetical protein